MLTRLRDVIPAQRYKYTILLVGLDHSGKSTLLQFLKTGVPLSENDTKTVPTTGLAMEYVRRHSTHYTVLDMSGQGRYRDFWLQYYAEAHAIIFVMDCSDTQRIATAKQELDAIFQNEVIEQRKTPVLIFANKWEQPGAISLSECRLILELDKQHKSLQKSSRQLLPCNAQTGVGVNDAMDWLQTTLKS